MIVQEHPHHAALGNIAFDAGTDALVSLTAQRLLIHARPVKAVHPQDALLYGGGHARARIYRQIAALAVSAQPQGHAAAGRPLGIGDRLLLRRDGHEGHVQVLLPSRAMVRSVPRKAM